MESQSFRRLEGEATFGCGYYSVWPDGTTPALQASLQSLSYFSVEQNLSLLLQWNVSSECEDILIIRFLGRWNARVGFLW